jgi:DNA-binding MarR family transcriptional regulator
LQNTTGQLLARTCKLLRIRAHTLLGEIGLYRGQQFVLSALWDQEGINQSELAEQLHVQPATITNALQRMERAGLVERRHDTEDRRVSRVYLTDAGRDIREAVEAIWAELEERAFAGLSPEEIEVFRRLMAQVYDNLIHGFVG